MWNLRLQTRNSSVVMTPALALEANVACAGLALGCAYSSSDEYEAEIVRVRRAAGAYGMSNQQQAYIAFAIAGAAIVAVLLVL